MNRESQNPMFHTEFPAAARAMEPGADEPPPATRPVSSLHRFVPWREDEVDAETLVNRCVLVGLQCYACLLLVATCFDVDA